MQFVQETIFQSLKRSKLNVLTIVAIAVTAIAFIFCTTVGIKIVMENGVGIGLCNIALGICNLMFCVCNIMRLLSQSAGV